MIRDQALAVSGLLVPRLGGPPVYPYQPAGLVSEYDRWQADYPGTTYTESTGDDLYRRSLYTFWKRTVPHPTLSTFDSPDREFCTARRSITNTPLQAMVLMNDPAYLEAARELADADAGRRRRQRRAAVGVGVRTADGAPAEAGRADGVRATAGRSARASSPRRKQRLPGCSRSAPRSRATPYPEAELAAYASVASMLLNLDEAITRN